MTIKDLIELARKMALKLYESEEYHNMGIVFEDLCNRFERVLAERDSAVEDLHEELA